MIFNGQSPEVVDALDEETFSQILVLYADGMIGPSVHYDTSATLVSALVSTKEAVVSRDKVFPHITSYFNHKDEETIEREKHNSMATAFLSMPGISDRLKTAGYIEGE